MLGNFLMGYLYWGKLLIDFHATQKLTNSFYVKIEFLDRSVSMKLCTSKDVLIYRKDHSIRYNEKMKCRSTLWSRKSLLRETLNKNFPYQKVDRLFFCNNCPLFTTKLPFRCVRQVIILQFSSILLLGKKVLRSVGQHFDSSTVPKYL